MHIRLKGGWSVRKDPVVLLFPYFPPLGRNCYNWWDPRGTLRSTFQLHSRWGFEVVEGAKGVGEEGVNQVEASCLDLILVKAKHLDQKHSSICDGHGITRFIPLARHHGLPSRGVPRCTTASPPPQIDR
ncbi:hypothetical protein Salat_0147500 [Sesamum alatum]|uniref:Uncharacterized protein n=1 Tax=Sesamum alatum TaxID=300844 RepID=A0AAE1YXB0_9LAMI|nr:hypothetical protein Salat_0147500 [Sesamum alatum]